MKKYIVIGIGILIFLNSYGQSIPIKRTVIQTEKIKTISYSKYTKWDRENQCKLRKGVLTDITIENYDTCGNLIVKTNQTNIIEISDVMNFTWKYQYDHNNNLIYESIKNNFLPIDDKWEYKYDSLNRKIEETSFDWHRNPFQKSFYFYNTNGLLIRDSLTQQGRPLLLTTFTYEHEKLINKTTVWAKKVKFQTSRIEDYYYNKKGLLIKIVFFFSYASDDDIKGGMVNRYRYDNKGRLIKEKIEDRVIKYIYDKEGNIVKRIDYGQKPVKKLGFKIPDYDIIKYEYY